MKERMKMTENYYPRDQMVVFNEFANKVADTLNEAGVAPAFDEGEDGFCAVMVVVKREHDEDPYGGALNWNKESKRWEVDHQIDTGRIEHA